MEKVKMELPRVDSTAMQNWFGHVKAAAGVHEYQVCGNTRAGEKTELCATLKDAEIAAYRMAEEGYTVSVWQWVPRHKKHVERMAFWVYVLHEDRVQAWGEPSLYYAELGHNRNKLGHNYKTLGYTTKMISMSKFVKETEKRFGLPVHVEF